jgi:hypothetical protein
MTPQDDKLKNTNNLTENLKNISSSDKESQQIWNSKRGPNSCTSKKKWSDEEDKKLIHLAKMTKGRRWKWIADQISGKTDTQCRSRYERIRPGMKQGRWTTAEDYQLTKLYGIYGDKWSEIARLMENRTGKQVRDRIKNVLDPNLNKTDLTQNENELLYKLYEEKGTKWREIRDSYFKDRSVDFIKNHFYSIYRKKTKKISRAKFKILKKTKIPEINNQMENNSSPVKNENSFNYLRENFNNDNNNSTLKTSDGKISFTFRKYKAGRIF